MSTCVTVPTETVFSTFTVTTQTLFTTVFVSTITLPPSTTVISSTICSTTSSQTGSCSVSTSVSTIDGGTSLTTLPTTNTIPTVVTTSTPAQTLSSTSCFPLPASDQTSAQPLPSDSTALSTPTTDVQTISQSSTLPDGSVVFTSVVVTKTMDPTSVTITGTAPSLNHNNQDNGSSHKGALIGGIVGGTVGLLALLAGIWFVWRRSKRWKDIFDEEDDEKSRRRMRLDHEDVQPRPYLYGLVGHTNSPSPPGSPRLSLPDFGQGVSHSTPALYVPGTSHSRSSSGEAISMDSMGRRSFSDLVSASNMTTRPHLRQQNISTGSAASSRPLLLERSVRPPSSWSIGAETAGSSGRGRSSSAARPSSAGEVLQSPSIEPTTPAIASPQLTEKQRLLASLPPGAAPPLTSSSATATRRPTTPNTPVTPAPPVMPTSPPPILPRNPARPSTGKSTKSAVIVHQDAGPAPASHSDSSSETTPPSGTTPDGAPPAYSPT